MKVKEIIEKLNKYNGEAEFEVVVKGRSEPFEVCYGSSEGCTPLNCEEVCLMIDTEPERAERDKNDL